MSAQELILKANFFLKTKNFSAAEELLREALKTNPTRKQSTECHTYIAVCALKLHQKELGDISVARTAVDQAWAQADSTHPGGKLKIKLETLKAEITQAEENAIIAAALEQVEVDEDTLIADALKQVKADADSKLETVLSSVTSIFTEQQKAFSEATEEAIRETIEDIEIQEAADAAVAEFS